MTHTNVNGKRVTKRNWRLYMRLIWCEINYEYCLVSSLTIIITGSHKASWWLGYWPFFPRGSRGSHAPDWRWRTAYTCSRLSFYVSPVSPLLPQHSVFLTPVSEALMSQLSFLFEQFGENDEPQFIARSEGDIIHAFTLYVKSSCFVRIFSLLCYLSSEIVSMFNPFDGGRSK